MIAEATHISHLKLLAKLIATGDESEAKDTLESFLNNTEDMGPFDPKVWTPNLRVHVYWFGASVNRKNYWVVESIDRKLRDSPDNEFYTFLKSEVILKTLDAERIQKFLDEMIDKYPNNPEFRHTKAGWLLYRNQDDIPLIKKQIEQLKYVLELEPGNEKFLEGRAKAEQHLVEELIKTEQYKEVMDLAKSITEEGIYRTRNFYPIHNSFAWMHKRAADQIRLNEKFKSSEVEVLRKVNEELVADRKRTIEVLAFFTGIIAFILSAIQLTQQREYSEAIGLILAIGTVLITFCVALSVLFGSSSDAVQKRNFWLLVFILLISILAALL